MLYEVITVLGLPIPVITLERAGASAVVLALKDGENITYEGLEKAAAYDKSDLRIFGKPSAREYRRMGVTLAYDKVGSDINQLTAKAIKMANDIKVIVK